MRALAATVWILGASMTLVSSEAAADVAPLDGGAAANAAAAWSRTCPVMEGASAALAMVPARDRFAFVRERLADDAATARAWTWTFGAGLAVATVAQIAAPEWVGAGQRPDYYLRAGASLVGFLVATAVPLEVMRDQAGLETWLATAPPLHPCSMVSTAERLLVRDARDELGRTRTASHVANLAFNAGLGMVLAMAFERWRPALVNAVAGAAIGELMLVTLPEGSARALSQYRRGALGAVGTARRSWRRALAVVPTVAPDGAGVSVAARF